MRRLFLSWLLVLAATAAAAHLAAQGRPTITVTQASTGTTVTNEQVQAVPSARIDLFKDLSTVPLGMTDGKGVFPYNPSLLSGKPLIDVRTVQCRKQSPLIDLRPSGSGNQAEWNKCLPGCSCNRKTGAFIWGNDYSLNLGTPTFAAQDESFFWDSPLSYVLVGGAAAGGILLATSGSSTSTGGGGTPTVTFGDGIGTYPITAVNISRGACSFNSNFTGMFYVGGTTSSTSLIFTEAAVFNYSGTATVSGNTIAFQGSSSGSIPGLGTYTASIVGTIVVSASGVKTFAATETISLSCGTVVNSLHGTLG